MIIKTPPKTTTPQKHSANNNSTNNKKNSTNNNPSNNKNNSTKNNDLLTNISKLKMSRKI